MDPQNILVWNARGLNRPDRCNSVCDVILSANADIVCLQETKVAAMNQRLFLSVFGSNYDKHVALPANGTRRGIVIAWKPTACQVISSRVDSSVSIHVAEQEGRNWWFTGVYGPQSDDERILFLQELRDVRALRAGPWLLSRLVTVKVVFSAVPIYFMIVLDLPKWAIKAINKWQRGFL